MSGFGWATGGAEENPNSGAISSAGFKNKTDKNARTVSNFKNNLVINPKQYGKENKKQKVRELPSKDRFHKKSAMQLLSQRSTLVPKF